MRQYNSILTVWWGAVLAAGIVGTLAFPARAQEERAIAGFVGPGQPPREIIPERGDMGEYLARMNYDPAQNGPLIVVAPDKDFPLERSLPSADKPAPALGSVAAAFGRKIVNVGRLTVLTPKEMTVIDTSPDKARLLDGLDSDATFRYLFSTLTETQWAKACSDGLLLADMTPEQRPFFDKLLPPNLKIRKNTVTKIERAPNLTSISFSGDSGEAIAIDRSQMRLRFVWNPSFSLQNADSKESSFFGGAPFENLEEGQSVYMRSYEGNNREQDRTQTYGVPVVARIPNRLKSGELDFAASALNAPVALPNDIKTVGGILSAISAAVHLEILADRRVAALPAFVRVAAGVGGQNVRAGDVLEGLAWSVAGAYRRMDARTFLLTYDVEGIGTQWLRVKQWAEEAGQDKSRILEKGMEQATKRLSLSALRFPPNDPRALPPDFVTKIEEKWRDGEMSSGIETETSALPGPLQTEVTKLSKRFDKGENAVRLRADLVTMNLQMRAQWVPPGGEKIQGMDRYMLDVRELARFVNGGKVPEQKGPPTSANAPKPKRYFDPKLMRRALILTPTTPKEAEDAIAAAKKVGFTEFWFPQPLDKGGKTDGNALALLNAALAAGKKAGMPVYAVVSLLKHVGAGEYDRNLLGLTGDEWVTQEEKRQDKLQKSLPPGTPDYTEDNKAFLAPLRGWVAPTPDVLAEVARRAAGLAGTPGLFGLVLRDSTPPGYYAAPGPERYSDGGAANGGMGYAPFLRNAFLRAEGIDPVDLAPDYIGVGNLDMTLPFFSTADFQPQYKTVNNQTVPDGSDTPPALWTDFRDKQSVTLLAEVYNAVRKAAPDLPLYQDDRKSASSGAFTFFGSFDAPGQTPRVPFYSGNGLAQAARTASKTVLLHLNSAPKPYPGTAAADWPDQFAEAVHRDSVTAAASWDGLVVDAGRIPFKKALPLLSGIEPTPK